jgi:hypothetical protein
MTQLAMPLWQKYVPLKRNGQRDWKAITDEHLLAYSKSALEVRGIKNRHGLEKSDSALYQALRKRDLIGKAISEKRETRTWSFISDDSLVFHARAFIENNGITNRHGLEKADRGLYAVLRNRGLIKEAIFEKRKTRDWASLSDGKLVRLSQRFIEDNRISNRKELARSDRGLCQILRRRGLMGRVISLDHENRRLHKLSDEQILLFTQKLINKKRIASRRELKKEDSRLYSALARRGLMEKIGLGPLYRNWTAMSDEQLVCYAREVINRRRLTTLRELREFDNGLEQILRKRALTLDVGLSPVRRNWEPLSDPQLVFFAQKFIRDKEIKNRSGLRKTDAGLYDVLKVRGLMDSVFDPIKKKHGELLVQLFEAVDTYTNSAK